MDEVDETVARVRVSGPLPLPLRCWDHASIWGWDEVSSSLYAELRRNADDLAKPSIIRIGADDFTPAIAFAATLSQHIAMATNSDPWDVLTALYEATGQNEENDTDWNEEDKDAEASDGGTVVTIAEGYEMWWPP